MRENQNGGPWQEEREPDVQLWGDWVLYSVRQFCELLPPQRRQVHGGGGAPGTHPVPDAVCLQGHAYSGQMTTDGVHLKGSTLVMF